MLERSFNGGRFQPRTWSCVRLPPDARQWREGSGAIPKWSREREASTYRPMPILFNEDDHFDFDQPENNMLAAIGEYASWGYFDPEGYQSPPVNWGITSPRQKAFFGLVEQITRRAI